MFRAHYYFELFLKPRSSTRHKELEGDGLIRRVEEGHLPTVVHCVLNAFDCSQKKNAGSNQLASSSLILSTTP